METLLETLLREFGGGVKQLSIVAKGKRLIVEGLICGLGKPIAEFDMLTNSVKVIREHWSPSKVGFVHFDQIVSRLGIAKEKVDFVDYL